MSRSADRIATAVHAGMGALQRAGDVFGTSHAALIVTDEPASVEERAAIEERAQYYVPWLAKTLEFSTSYSPLDVVSTRPIFLRSRASRATDLLRKIRPNTFDVRQSNPLDGWQWCRANYHATRASIPQDVERRFASYVGELRKVGLSKSYVLGTGPSLERAAAQSWSDGYRIVCNTIVRDAELWKHIDPHFIVAADAIYHFGFTAFARRFRADVKARLTETNTYFVYPETFHGLVADELSAVAERLIPVPLGQHTDMHASLLDRFALPNLGNILNLVLLPLACTLSKDVYLWGFDGRAPNDKLFWANSSKHSYPELMDTLRAAHPAFFEHHVPADKPNKYVNAVHGDLLDRCLAEAEQRGWSFTMMHKSWTPTLQKRFRE